MASVVIGTLFAVVVVLTVVGVIAAAANSFGYDEGRESMMKDYQESAIAHGVGTFYYDKEGKCRFKWLMPDPPEPKETK